MSVNDDVVKSDRHADGMRGASGCTPGRPALFCRDAGRRDAQKRTIGVQPYAPQTQLQRCSQSAIGTGGLSTRSDATWYAGEAFLIERARLGRLTSYTALNATLERRTGLCRFDFGLQADRAAMGRLPA